MVTGMNDVFLTNFGFLRETLSTLVYWELPGWLYSLCREYSQAVPSNYIVPTITRMTKTAKTTIKKAIAAVLFLAFFFACFSALSRYWRSQVRYSWNSFWISSPCFTCLPNSVLMCSRISRSLGSACDSSRALPHCLQYLASPGLSVPQEEHRQ
jgi:Fe2+ transport system protein B